MIQNNEYKIKKGVFLGDYRILITSLYKKYPAVVRSKISEFEKAFSPKNPSLKYSDVENYFLLKNKKVVGHVAAIADNRFGDIGTIGFFECENNLSSAKTLFENATEFFIKSGKKQCRGPINMTVWQNFRVSYPENKAPFFLEPFTLEYYRDLFLGNNFIVGHQNVTTIESVDKTQIRDYEDSYLKSINDGYLYELLDEKNLEESISNIYSLTHKIFEGGYSFYKISKEEFLYFAEQYTEIPKPHYIFVLKNKRQEPVGFFFAIPDLFNPELKRVVLKTMGLIPEYRGLGLGGAMLYFVYKNAKKDGFRELMYSTMSIDNERMKSLLGQGPAEYRKYEVYEKSLT